MSDRKRTYRFEEISYSADGTPRRHAFFVELDEYIQLPCYEVNFAPQSGALSTFTHREAQAWLEQEPNYNKWIFKPSDERLQGDSTDDKVPEPRGRFRYLFG